MDDDDLDKVERYAAEYNLTLQRGVGAGIHGTVFKAFDQHHGAPFVVKLLDDEEAFAREVAVYRRLTERRVVTVLGYNVPQFLGADEPWLAIRMSFVRRPFVLDLRRRT